MEETEAGREEVKKRGGRKDQTGDFGNIAEKGREQGRLLTGHTLTDINLGGEKGVFGLEFGRCYNIWGAEQSGKSFFCGNMVGYNHMLYGDKFLWKYDDVENGFTFKDNGANLWGVEVIDESFKPSDSLDQLLVHITNFCKSVPKGGRGLYIIDSLDLLMTRAQMAVTDSNIDKIDNGKEADKATMGAAARGLYLKQTFFPKVTSMIKECNVAFFMVSQASTNMNASMFGPKLTETGGRAKKHANHTVIELKNPQKEWHDAAKKLAKSITSTVMVKKGRTARPYRQNYFTCIFDYGVDSIGDNIDFLYDWRTDSGKGPNKTAKKSWDEQEFTKEKMIDWIESREQEDKLEYLVHEKWEKREDKVACKRKRRF